MLVRAENRWSKISTENDEDVSYWLTIVRGALSLRSGRNIPITAPLYPEMSQLLSAAQLNYNEGVRLLNANNRPDGLKKFAIAREKTQEVRLMFPVNQEAGILELKIDQIIDPPSFEQSFAQRVQAAISGSKNRSVQAFADLQNLVKINPRYPGIQAALSQAEIDMGVRPAPPDTRLIARSNEMLAAAQRLFRANNRSQYQTVLDNVNEALRLNPNNSAAIQFRQQVQLAMGSGAVSAEDRFTEQEYIRAVLALQNGNALLALSIVQRLRERPQSRSDPRITELLRRIEASTGAVN
jgi:tetratricopeptide (TPR) repeat protein